MIDSHCIAILGILFSVASCNQTQNKVVFIYKTCSMVWYKNYSMCRGIVSVIIIRLYINHKIICILWFV